MKLKVLTNPLDKGEKWESKSEREITIDPAKCLTTPVVYFGITKDNGKTIKVTEDLYLPVETAMEIASAIIVACVSIQKENVAKLLTKLTATKQAVTPKEQSVRKPRIIRREVAVSQFGLNILNRIKNAKAVEIKTCDFNTKSINSLYKHKYVRVVEFGNGQHWELTDKGIDEIENSDIPFIHKSKAKK